MPAGDSSAQCCVAVLALVSWPFVLIFNHQALSAHQMNPLLLCLCLAAAAFALAAGGARATAAQNAGTTTATTGAASRADNRRDVSEDMQLINKSLEGLLAELATIKREASGRLSQAKLNRVATPAVQVDSSASSAERIRQTKVSRFVLKRVAELESESLCMRDEMSKLFELQRKMFEAGGETPNLQAQGVARGPADSAPASRQQDDAEFDNEPAPVSTTAGAPSSTSVSGPTNKSTPATSAPTAATTTAASANSNELEASQIGFDLEQLKRLGEEIGKRLDQFGKEAAKNLGELVEGIRLVFREPPKKQRPARLQAQQPSASAELESEIEARQAQSVESLRGVHEQVIRLVDNMVQNYLGNMRRAVQRFTTFVDGRRPQQAPRQAGPAEALSAAPQAGVEQRREQLAAVKLGQSILSQLQSVSKQFREFTFQWSKTLGKQQSPLFDRIPPRGVELWVDFWHTVRRQMRHINERFWQVSRDMSRVLTGGLPSTGTRVIIRPGGSEREQVQVAGEAAHEVPQMYAKLASAATSEEAREQQIKQEFEDFYEKLTQQLKREQQKMSELAKASGSHQQQQQQQQQQVEVNQLIDELDDEATRKELTNNLALRQQIAQEISVFGSIFDIMRTFIQRLRESATNIRDVLQPSGAINSNDAVTPGPSVKPTVDKLLEDTINSQRNINSQARPTSH